MIFINAFLLCGFTCLVAQIILDLTNLTPGHVTSLFVALGAFLSFLGIYDKLIELAGAGATLLISNFGHMLYKSGYLGLQEEGFLGIFSNMLNLSSSAIVSVIVFSLIFTIIYKPKN